VAVTTSGTTVTGIRHGVTVLQLNIMPTTDQSMWVTGRSRRIRVIADVQAVLQQMGYYTGESGWIARAVDPRGAHCLPGR